MQCSQVRDRLLELGQGDDDVQEHLAQCTACASRAAAEATLDQFLRSSLIVDPPADLQIKLAALAAAAAREPLRTQTVWAAFRSAVLENFGLVLAQLAAGLTLVLVLWQALSAIGSYSPFLGDVPFALQLVASSPAAAYIGDIAAQAQPMLIWGLVGIVGWLLIEGRMASQVRSEATFGSKRPQAGM